MNEITRFDMDMDGSMEPSEHGQWVRYEDAITTIKEALAQPEQEPVVFDMSQYCCGYAKIKNGEYKLFSMRTTPVMADGQLHPIYALTDEQGELVHSMLTSTPQRKPLAPVDGDLLPAVGSQVLIHLASQDEWVERTVVGYYVWGAFDSDRLHRVYVRVQDSDGIINARMLGYVRPIEAAHKIKE